MCNGIEQIRKKLVDMKKQNNQCRVCFLIYKYNIIYSLINIFQNIIISKNQLNFNEKTENFRNYCHSLKLWIRELFIWKEIFHMN